MRADRVSEHFAIDTQIRATLYERERDMYIYIFLLFTLSLSYFCISSPRVPREFIRVYFSPLRVIPRSRSRVKPGFPSVRDVS